MNIPQKLDWVEKRAACSIAEVFHRLCLEVEGDITAVNAIKYKDDIFRHFQRDYAADGSLVVAQPKRIPRVTVMIGVVDQKIMVRDQATQKQWAVTVGLNDEGRCILRLENADKSVTELEQWQFRKKALESLFFGDTA